MKKVVLTLAAIAVFAQVLIPPWKQTIQRAVEGSGTVISERDVGYARLWAPIRIEPERVAYNISYSVTVYFEKLYAQLIGTILIAALLYFVGGKMERAR